MLILSSSPDRVNSVFTPETWSIDVKADCNARPGKHINEKVKRLIQIMYLETMTSFQKPVVETILILPRC